MMRILMIGLMLVLTEQATASGTEVSFLQAATTTKRDGSAPAPVMPSVVGTPSPRPDEMRYGEPLRPVEQNQPPFQRDGRRNSNEPGDGDSNRGNQQPQQGAPGAPASRQPSGTPGPVPSASATASSEKTFDFSFSNASIDTVIANIMRELGYSYVIDPQVTGTVSIFTQRGVPRSRLFEVLEGILKINGHGIVKQGDFYVIAPLGSVPRLPHGILVRPQSQAPQPPPSDPPTGSNAQPQGEAPPGTTVLPLQQSEEARQLDAEEGIVTYIIPLHYLSSEHVKQMAQVFVSEGANVIDFAPANILLITDHRRNIQQVLDLVNVLDTQYFDLNNVELIQIKNNMAKDVAEDLAKIFAPGDRSSIRIIAIPRLNSILAVTHAPSVLQQLKDWVEKLDSPSASTNLKTFVYQVENNTAMNIADVLSQLYQDGTGLPSSATGDPVNQQMREPGFVGSQGRLGARGSYGGYGGDYGGYGGGGYGGGGYGGYGGAGGGYGGYGGGGGYGGMRGGVGPSLRGRPMSSSAGVRAVVSENLKVIVNEFNNSLIIQATQADYDFLLETIRQLDVLPRQVQIEAKIYRVQLTDDLSFGVAAFLEKRGATGTEVVGPATVGSINLPSQGSAGGALSIVTRTLIGAERQLEAAITALRSKTEVELMEAPRLMAMDGMQATFNVGAEVPVTTASYGDPLQSGNISFINSIQFRPTGTTLLISPRISASGIVTMDLAIEVSSSSGTLTPTINRNYVETSLIIRDGQTIAIAGLISDHFDLSRSRVPVLGDIPILGTIFGQTSRAKSRHELIILITPHVIPNLPTAAELTLEFRRALRKAYDYIRKQEEEEQELIRKRREKESKELQELERRQQQNPQGSQRPEREGHSGNEAILRSADAAFAPLTGANNRAGSDQSGGSLTPRLNGLPAVLSPVFYISAKTEAAKSRSGFQPDSGVFTFSCSFPAFR
jgi:general secretion pathway protein D